MSKRMAGALTLLSALFLMLGPQASADGLSLNVGIDTSALGQSGPSEIFFVFTDGNAPSSGGNTATIGNFSFGTGGSTGLVDTSNIFGDVTFGTNLSDGATMTSDQFTDVFAGFFTAGTNLSFLLNLSTNLASGAAAPDQLSIYLVDPNGNPIGTNDPTGLDSLLTISIDSANPSANTYSSIVNASPVGTVPTPEPATTFLLATGLAGIGILKRRTRASNA